MSFEIGPKYEILYLECEYFQSDQDNPKKNRIAK